jgi:hypothetical protein
MKVAMMQPSFLPWLGFFELVNVSDIFIFLDDFQFSAQSYHQRNRLFINQGTVDWYTVPVRKCDSFKMPLTEALINDEVPWRKKLLKRVTQNYSKAPFFRLVFDMLERHFDDREASLGELNIAIIQSICKLLGLERDFRRSSGLPSEACRSRRVLELLRWSETDTYYAAQGSFLYMLEDGVFPVEDITLLFQDFHPAPYRQIGSSPEFMPYLSIVDALFNLGPESTLSLIKTGTPRWKTWEQMKSAVSKVHETANMANEAPE